MFTLVADAISTFGLFVLACFVLYVVFRLLWAAFFRSLADFLHNQKESSDGQKQKERQEEQEKEK